ncbi:hypothetical protein V1477_018444 [Vespula maculifrons]|uniref:Uncharacterized protein n=1 Tax=Vespula maculifrons TaxID=7453 RepID=A0ABD2AVH0_VESMC
MLRKYRICDRKLYNICINFIPLCKIFQKNIERIFKTQTIYKLYYLYKHNDKGKVNRQLEKSFWLIER